MIIPQKYRQAVPEVMVEEYDKLVDQWHDCNNAYSVLESLAEKRQLVLREIVLEMSNRLYFHRVYEEWFGLSTDEVWRIRREESKDYHKDALEMQEEYRLHDKEGYT